MTYKLYVDGFDTYNTYEGLQRYLTFGQSAINNYAYAIIQCNAGRRDSGAITAKANFGSAFLSSKTFTPSTNFVLGVAYRPSDALSCFTITFGNNYVGQITLHVMYSQFIQVYLGGSIDFESANLSPALDFVDGRLWTSTNQLRVNSWNYIEFGVTTGSGGGFEVRVNGSTAGWCPFTAFIGSAFSAGPFNYFSFAASYGISANYDDLYLTYGNELKFLGDVRVDGYSLAGNNIPQQWDVVQSSATELLLHFDVTTSATTYLDSSSLGCVTSICAGRPLISIAHSKFGGASCYFDGASAIAVSMQPTAIFKDFTLEFWYRATNFQGNVVIVSGGDSDAYANNTHWFRLGLNPSGILFFEIKSRISENDFYIEANTIGPYVAGVFNHIAVTRSNLNVIQIFVNGVSVAQGTYQTFVDFAFNKYLRIGNDTTGGPNMWDQYGYIVGYIDDLRLSHYAVYTTNFTPPSAALANIATVPAYQVINGGSGQLQTTTVGNIAAFDSYPILNNPIAIHGIQLNTTAHKDDAGYRGITSLIISGATTQLSTTEQVLSTAAETVTATFITDPNTSIAWTKTGINAALVGVKLTS